VERARKAPRTWPRYRCGNRSRRSRHDSGCGLWRPWCRWGTGTRNRPGVHIGSTCTVERRRNGMTSARVAAEATALPATVIRVRRPRRARAMAAAPRSAPRASAVRSCTICRSRTKVVLRARPDPTPVPGRIPAAVGTWRRQRIGNRHRGNDPARHHPVVAARRTRLGDRRWCCGHACHRRDRWPVSGDPRGPPRSHRGPRRTMTIRVNRRVTRQIIG
jgi:hypothetical protein